MKILILLIIIYNIIGTTFIIYLHCLYYINLYYVKQKRDFYIYHETNDKRYIDYYPNVLLSLNEEKNFPLKYFTFNNYELFCFCKNDTKFRIFDLNFCFTSKECDSNIQITPKNYKINYLSKWNKKKIYDNKQRYNFLQGVNNITKKCDYTFNYKKCGFLMDLKIDFCIKENDICPFYDTDTNFYLTNLTSNIILLFEDKNLKIDNKYEISDFLPDIYILNNNNTKEIIYEKYDSINLFKFAFDNNIHYLKEKIYNKTKNYDIDLGLLKLDIKKDIKLNQNLFYETKFISKFEISDNFLKTSTLIMIILISANIVTIFTGILYTFNETQIETFSGLYIFIFTLDAIIGGILIIMFLFLLYSTKEKLDKEYKFNEEYYKTIKSIRNIIIILVLIIITVGYNILLILIYECRHSRCCLKYNKNKKKFVEIAETSISS